MAAGLEHNVWVREAVGIGDGQVGAALELLQHAIAVEGTGDERPRQRCGSRAWGCLVQGLMSRVAYDLQLAEGVGVDGSDLRIQRQGEAAK